MSIIGERITARIRALGLKQRAVASRVGISIRTLASHLDGSRNPRGHLLAEYAKILETTIAYLTGETDDPSPQEKKQVRYAIELGESVTQKQIERQTEILQELDRQIQLKEEQVLLSKKKVEVLEALGSIETTKGSTETSDD